MPTTEENIAEILAILKRLEVKLATIEHSQDKTITDLLSAILEIAPVIGDERLKLAKEAKKNRQ